MVRMGHTRDTLEMRVVVPPRTSRRSAEERAQHLRDDDEDEVADGHGGKEAEGRAPGRSGGRVARSARLRHDKPGDHAADNENDDDVEREVEGPQIPAGEDGSTAQRDVIGEIDDAEHDCDEQAREYGPDDGPRRVAELAPADFEPAAPADDAPWIRRLGHDSTCPRIVRRGRLGRVVGVCAARSSTMDATRSISSAVVKNPTLIRSAPRSGTVRAIAKIRPFSSASASSGSQPAIRKVTRVAIRSSGVSSSTPSIRASRSAAARAIAWPRSWIHGSPTYMESHPQLRARPVTPGR